MAWTRYQIFLAGLLVFTGSLNTLATKFADGQDAPGRTGGVWKNGTSLRPTTEVHNFNHPFLQATGMFVGEFSCLLVFRIVSWIHAKRNTPESELPDIVKGNQDFNPFIFYLPALCDMVGTSMMYIGLTLTYASSFQMLRGAVIIFTGIFSMVFLKAKLHRFKWLGIVLVLVGLIVVGVSDILHADADAKALGGNTEGQKSSSAVITGDLIIVGAQVITALQMVLEEGFVSKTNVAPLQAVGLEGLFGMITLGALLVPFYFIKIGHVPIDDSIDGIVQIFNNRWIAVGFGGTLLSISFFNYAGISVTKQLSATTRMVLDSVRTIIIWAVSLGVSWQIFHYETVIGFVVLLSGMAVYNNLLIVPFMASKGWITNPEDEEEKDTGAFADEPVE
ncbi:solute carrier family 35 member F6 [Galendromus occidentalis]|uniref:Solute carrier family 35 member F6 n=1 Tax=Galendromus occidentalis TaxID=34638 RepID=A0AAJ6QU75_9ACAR|nr:solute carrier family 35 member F6 [Galendromus occidentalis]